MDCKAIEHESARQLRLFGELEARFESRWQETLCRIEWSLKLRELCFGSSASNLGRRAVVFEEHEVVRLARLAVDREGGQSAFAKRHGVDRVYINVVLNGKRRVSDSVAKALRLRKLFVAE